jgi:PIN domain-containing protein
VQLLLDEDVPKPLVPALRRILAGHEVIHVDDLRWKGKKDLNLLADAAQRGFDAILTNDSKQLDDAAECRAIRDSGLHHIRYRQQTGRRDNSGLNGLALALGAILAGIRQVVRELDEADGQRLVLIHEIRSERRHDTIDPRIDPPPYWPSKPSPTRRKRQ